ncbi:MAG: helix-turn-helix domain-containing protein [Acetobacteraceae bacterium]
MSHTHLHAPGHSDPSDPLGAGPGEVLRAIPWLAAVSPATLGRLAEHAVLHRVPAGSMLFEQAETPAFAQILVAGSVELLGVSEQGETRIELVSAVDLLLPAAVLTRQPYLLRARVLEEAHLLMVQADAFRLAVTQDHALCLAVLACQAAQFRRQVKQAKNVRLRSAEERIGCYLLRLLGKTKPDTPVRLPLNKRQIASELGMTRETFSRALGGVARHGLRIDGDVVVLHDPAAAYARFRLDPLIDGIETIQPLPRQGAEG